MRSLFRCVQQVLPVVLFRAVGLALFRMITVWRRIFSRYFCTKQSHIKVNAVGFNIDIKTSQRTGRFNSEGFVQLVLSEVLTGKRRTFVRRKDQTPSIFFEISDAITPLCRNQCPAVIKESIMPKAERPKYQA